MTTTPGHHYASARNYPSGLEVCQGPWNSMQAEGFLATSDLRRREAAQGLQPRHGARDASRHAADHRAESGVTNSPSNYRDQGAASAASAANELPGYESHEHVRRDAVDSFVDRNHAGPPDYEAMAYWDSVDKMMEDARKKTRGEAGQEKEKMPTGCPDYEASEYWAGVDRMMDDIRARETGGRVEENDGKNKGINWTNARARHAWGQLKDRAGQFLDGMHRHGANSSSHGPQNNIYNEDGLLPGADGKEKISHLGDFVQTAPVAKRHDVNGDESRRTRAADFRMRARGCVEASVECHARVGPDEKWD